MRSRATSYQGAVGFDPERLAGHLREEFGLSARDWFAVGFSGGADSTALLLALARFLGPDRQERLLALHFNHCIHPDSGRWQAHCQSVCAQLGVPMLSQHWQRGEAPRPTEAEARDARYGWFREVLPKRYVLCLAQHRDDQVETVLMNLMEQRAMHRVAGIRPRRFLAFGDTREVLRPLLGFNRLALRDYVRREGVAWIEDPANRDATQRRAWLRHDVIPGLRALAPELDQRLERSAHLLQRVVAMQRAGYRADLGEIQAPAGRRLFCLVPPLSINRLLQHDRNDVLALLRMWIHDAALESPGNRALHQLIDSLSLSQSGSKTSSRLAWRRNVIQGYRDLLYLFEIPGVADVGRPRPGTERQFDGGLAVHWPATCNPENLQWCWRQGGERIRLAGRSQRTTLKKAWQHAGVPPWERQALPFLAAGSELVWVHGIGWCGSMADAVRRSGGVGQEPRFFRR